MGAGSRSMVESAVTDDFRFVPLAEQHLAMLHEWLQRPHVAKWWAPTPSVAELRNDYLSPAAEQGTRAHIAFLGAEPLGFIQSYVVMGSGGKFATQMKKADASGARYALIVGEDEVAAQRVTLKPLRGGGSQETLEVNEVLRRLKQTIQES